MLADSLQVGGGICAPQILLGLVLLQHVPRLSVEQRVSLLIIDVSRAFVYWGGAHGILRQHHLRVKAFSVAVAHEVYIDFGNACLLQRVFVAKGAQFFAGHVCNLLLKACLVLQAVAKFFVAFTAQESWRHLRLLIWVFLDDDEVKFVELRLKVGVALVLWLSLVRDVALVLLTAAVFDSSLSSVT